MAKQQQYIGVVRHSPGADYVIEYPDFLGCIVSGSSLEQAREKAEAKLQERVEALLSAKKGLPKPTPMKKLMEDPYYADAFIYWSVVDLLSLQLQRREDNG